MDNQLEPALALRVSADKLRLQAEITHFAQGHGITCAAVSAAASEQGVLETYLDESAINALLTDGERRIIAQGREPQHGRDAEFTETFFVDDDPAPNLDAADVAHYYQTKRYISVDEGEIVMRRTPATDGLDGVTLMGKPIKAKKGKNLKFKKYPGSKTSESDPDVLLSAVKGHPILQQQGVKVDPTLVFKEADLATGNINFDGSVLINGDVHPQVSIMATGDVFIKGAVQDASVEAGDNIVINGGVLSTQPPGKYDSLKITTKIKAGGDINAKFLTQAGVKATGNIQVQNLVMNCEVIAEQSLTVGVSGGKGCLIGGTTIVGSSVTANEIGSGAYVPTQILCSDAAEARTKFANTSSLLHRRIRERNQMLEILDRIAKDPAPTIGEITINRRKKIEAAIENINKILKHLREEQGTRKQEIADADAAFIQAKRKLYPGTNILINGKHYVPNEERRSTMITCPEGQLKIS